MLHTDSRFASTVEQTVGRVERSTDAEVVVVATPRSGSYLDLALYFGIAVAWLMLVFVLFSPWAFSGSWLPLELPLIGAAATWFVHRSPGLLRLLAPASRMRRQVMAGAAQAFHEEAVHGTRERTGLMIYLSALEDRVVVIPDAGIEARIPASEWNALKWGDKAEPTSPGDLDHFVAGLEAAGEVLARHIPPLDDNPDEISNAPRIRS